MKFYTWFELPNPMNRLVFDQVINAMVMDCFVVLLPFNETFMSFPINHVVCFCWLYILCLSPPVFVPFPIAFCIILVCPLLGR